MELPAPRLYFPIVKGRYEVVAGLRPIEATECFEIDQEWMAYRKVRRQGRAERLEKYLPPEFETPPETLTVIAEKILELAAQRTPELFEGRGRSCECRLSGEFLAWDERGRLLPESRLEPGMTYRHLWDAVTSQFQEDFAVWRHEAGRQWLGAVSLFFPNHWAAEEKIGRDFAAVHAPVADFAPLAKRSTQFSEMMTTKGPFERFAWGVATDRRLNHHPVAPPGLEAEWAGRSFDPHNPQLFLRTERQTLMPFPNRCAGLFTIRTYFRDVRELTAEQRELVANAIATMSAESRAYKGLRGSAPLILDWLGRL